MLLSTSEVPHGIPSHLVVAFLFRAELFLEHALDVEVPRCQIVLDDMRVWERSHLFMACECKNGIIISNVLIVRSLIFGSIILEERLIDGITIENDMMLYSKTLCYKQHERQRTLSFTDDDK